MDVGLRSKIAVVITVLIGVSGFLLHKGVVFGLDLRGGVQFTLRVNVAEAQRIDPAVARDEIVEQARQAVDRRINGLGVLEPLILVQGSNRDELLVQLPGFTDVTRARSVLGTTARLEWKLLDALDRDAAVSGRDIRHARAITDGDGRPAVAFSLTPDGARRFGELTAANVGRQLAIVLDGRVHSSPVIEQAITGGEGQIRGSFTVREAADLALVLRSGALPVSLTILGGQYVGPTLGSESVHAGVIASCAGLALVAAFMLLYYRRAGINAIWSVIVNLVVLLGAMTSIGAALTLPGIAGLILTIGMGVDSNVLIFERIREELRAGRPARQAVRIGFERVFLTILDTHVASLVAAAFLFQFGTGPIRGFATTLTLGLLVNVFTAVVVSRTLFEWSLSRSSGTSVLAGLGSRATRIPAINFMAGRNYALGGSAILLVTGFALVVARGGLPFGLEFTGGTSVLARFTAPVTEDAVRRAIPGEETVQRYGPISDHTLAIRLPQSTRDGDDANLDPHVHAVRTALEAASLPSFEIAGAETVGPAVGRDLQKKGGFATFASLAGISAYIALRFRPSFAAGALVATAHDIAVTVTMLGVFGYDLTLNTVAAILTIAGYSVNDTIVIFDRVRETLRTASRGSMTDAVNVAVNQTLARTFITAGTTFLSVLALFLFGGEALRGFSFAMLIGIVAGTYSTVFIAAPIAARLAK